MKQPTQPRAFTGVRSRKSQQALTTLLAVCFFATVTACSGSDDDNQRPDTSTPAPSGATKSLPTKPSSSSTVDPVEQAVLDAYASMWTEQVKAYAKADTSGTDLHLYSGALAWATTRNDLKGLKDKGIVATGAPSHNVKVTSVKIDKTNKKAPLATLTDCMDTSEWNFIYAQSGKPVKMPANRIERYVTKVQAEKWGKKWKIIALTPQDRAC